MRSDIPSHLIDISARTGRKLEWDPANETITGDLDDVHQLRGTYSESWTVFWITAHFLNAAAKFAEQGVALDEPSTD